MGSVDDIQEGPISSFGCFGGVNSSNSSFRSTNAVNYFNKSSSLTRWWGEKGGNAVDPEYTDPDVDLEQAVANIFEMTLEMDEEPAKSKYDMPEKPSHERKLSWPFRKIAPKPEPPPSVLSSADSSTHFSYDSSPQSRIFSPEVVRGDRPPAAHTPSPDAAAAAKDAARPQGYRRLWQSITSVGKGDKVTARELTTQPQEYTVESLVRGVLSLKPSQPIMDAPRLASGLHSLDSRAVAALLKELAKAGAQHRASELFDYLRGLPEDNELLLLADLYTYTTVISQCGGHQHLRRALELVAEMRGRGIQCNVHTYSALMSVCVKCNECELALDVYEQLLSEGCTPNLVTYNILIDAYSRTGQWAKAADVLDPIGRQGLTPEARTYNSIISACGKAGQPAAALRVYERMIVDSVEPTGTTYTSIISAFGRAGLVDEALKMYKDMSTRGCEPNVITYSSLISVCERAGRAEAALELFEEMKSAGVRPNVVTFNGLVSACAHAGMWKKAAELVEGMPAAGCRPDGVTFSALIGAFETGGQWKQALQALEKAQASGVRPDAGAYNAVLGALWSSGRLPALAKAVQLLAAAQRQGAVRLQSLSAGEATTTAYTQGAATLVTLRWLCHFRDGLSAAAALAANPAMRSLLLMRGKHAAPSHSFEPIRDSLNNIFAAFSVPASAAVSPQGLMISSDARLLPSWAASASGLALLSVLDYAGSAAGTAGSTLLKDDRAAEVQCGKAFAAVRQFESAHSAQDLNSDALRTPSTSALRHDVIACITALSGGLQLREEVAHDAVQLCNRLLCQGPSTEQPPPAACAAALLLLACRQAGNAAAVLRHGQMALQAAGLPISTVLEAEQRILSTFGADPAAISPLRVLNLYLERLGCDDNTLQKCQLAHVMALTATDMIAKAALSPAFVRFDPSIVAAACLYRARASMGLVPAWPLVLHDMTAYSVDAPPYPQQDEQQQHDDNDTVQMRQCTDLLQLLGIST